MMSRLANEKDPNFLGRLVAKRYARSDRLRSIKFQVLVDFVFPGDRVDVIITHDISLSRK